MSDEAVIKCRTFSFITDGTKGGTQFVVDGKSLGGVKVCYIRFEAEQGTVGVTMENREEGNGVNYKVIKFENEERGKRAEHQ